MNRNTWALVLLVAGTIFVSSLIRLAVKHTPTQTEPTAIIGTALNQTQSEQITDIKTPKKQVYTLTLNPNRTLVLNTEVDGEAVDLILNKLQELNANNHEPIVLLLDSPGGSVFDGARLISFIEASPSPVYTVVIGLCASMCANVESHGAQRMMIDRTVLMYHPAAGGLRGQVDEMNSLLTFLIREVNKLDAYTADRAHMDRQIFKNMLLKQLWISADDALALHLIDKIVTLSVDVTANDKVFNLRHVMPVKPSNKEASEINLTLRSFR